MTDPNGPECAYGCASEVGGHHLGSVIAGDALTHVHAVLDLKGPGESKTVVLIVAAEEVREQRRILTRARQAADIGSPFIVALLDSGQTAEGVWLEAPRYATNLTELIHDTGRLAFVPTIAVLRDVARGLDDAHGVGIAHQNLKPANILLPGRGVAAGAVVTGFGIGRMHRVAAEVSASGIFPGTLNYVAPEQLEGAPITGPTDQYTLASIAVECLTGSPPYPFGLQAPVITAHLAGLPPSLHERRDELPIAVDRVIARAMARQPQQRYPTCSAFTDALADALLEPKLATIDLHVVDLLVVGGPSAGRRVPLKAGKHLIGRGEACDVAIDDPFLSRQHLIVTSTSDRLLVEDASSSNGTMIDGNVCLGSADYAPGQLIEAGSSMIQLARARSTAADRRPAAPPEPESDPDACAVIAAARGPRSSGWRRAPEHPSFLRYRIGFQSASEHPRDDPRPLPLTVTIPAGEPLVINGDAVAVTALARWLIVQAAVLRSPEDLSIAAIMPPSVDDSWAWVGTLPHATMAQGRLEGSHVATDPTTAAKLAERVISLADSARAESLPHLLLVVDRDLLSAPLCERLQEPCRHPSIHVVLIEGAQPARIPQSATQVRLHDGSTWTRVNKRPREHGTADGLTAHLAASVARTFDQK